MDNLKETVIWLFIFLGLVFFILKAQKSNWESLKKNGVYTSGVVTDFGRKQSVHWEYSLNGKNIKIIERLERFNGLQKGERFKAIYDPNDHSNAKILLNAPIIDWIKKDTIPLLDFPIGLTTRTHTAIFRYNVKGIIFEREQPLPEGAKWKEDDQYFIILNKNNPKVAYLKKHQ